MLAVAIFLYWDRWCNMSNSLFRRTYKMFVTFCPNKKQKFDRWSTQREQVGFHSDGWQYNRYLLVWLTSNGSNSRWPEERSHSIQSWLLFWKNNRGRDTPFLMSISGLLNCACMSVIPAGTLCHIFRMLLLSFWFTQLIEYVLLINTQTLNHGPDLMPAWPRIL